jgi:formate dehydrogenase assembly factor FdhD
MVDVDSGALEEVAVQSPVIPEGPVVARAVPAALPERGLTLCGFARRGSVNVYTGLERVGR